MKINNFDTKKDFINFLKTINNNFFIKNIGSIYLKKLKFLNKIYSDIEKLGIKKEDKNKINRIIEEIKSIKHTYIYNKNNVFFYKKRSLGCAFCTKGTGTTVVLSYLCNRDCFFCYEETPLNPKNKIDPYSKNDMDRIYKTIDTSFSNSDNKTLALTGGEPFMFKNKVYEVLEYVNKNYPGKNKRIYTNGDYITEEILIKLKELGLDEIRYSIKPFEEPNIDLYRLTKKYINSVLIEMPVLPNTEDYMIKILTKIEESNTIDGINLNEMTFNSINHKKYIEKGYKLDIDINNIYFNYFDLPKIEIGVYGSKYLCLKLLKYFAERESKMFIHYCDIKTVQNNKFVQRKKIAGKNKKSYSKLTKNSLHKILSIYSNINLAKKILDNKNIKDYYILKNDTNNLRLETSINNINFFDDRFLKAYIYRTPENNYDLDFELIQ